jgi:hypothetical protein
MRRKESSAGREDTGKSSYKRARLAEKEEPSSRFYGIEWGTSPHAQQQPYLSAILR